ncbi:MAG: hypothetical protein KU37_06770 [Sulfuricurvum sp. PC08-66]|nr:MAG: hypothetical protein KU37_06770 [Sulfuricurvum sp. PC08-66]
MRKALLVEDDIRLQKSIATFLSLLGYEVATASDGEKAFDLILLQPYDLYLLDVNLPHIDGLDLIDRVRSFYPSAPIIMLTASLEIATLEKAYTRGCSEYIKKPFNLKELQIRIERLLPPQPKTIAITPTLAFDPQTRTLTHEGTPIALRPKELRLLSLLCANANRLVSTSTIESYVWEDEIRDAYPVRQLVNQLREHLTSDAIETVHGNGYKLVCRC